jgi:hypothetical protein
MVFNNLLFFVVGLFFYQEQHKKRHKKVRSAGFEPATLALRGRNAWPFLARSKLRLGNSDDINRETPVHDNDYILFLVDSKRIFYSNTTTYTVKCIVIPSMNNTRNILMVTAII